MYEVQLPFKNILTNNWKVVEDIVAVYPMAKYKKVAEESKHQTSLGYLKYCIHYDETFKMGRVYVKIKIFELEGNIITIYTLKNIKTELDLRDYTTVSKQGNVVVAMSDKFHHSYRQHRYAIAATLAAKVVGPYVDILFEFENMSMYYACQYEGRDEILKNLSKTLKNRVGEVRYNIVSLQYCNEVFDDV